MDHVPDYTIGNLIIICATIQGVLFSLFIFLSKTYRDNRTCRFLGGLILFISFNNLYYWFIDTRLIFVYGWVYYRYFFIPWDLLVLPMFYFFVASYLKKEAFIKSTFIYPFYFGIFVHILLFFNKVVLGSPIQISTQSVKDYTRMEEYFTIAFSIYIIVKTWRLIQLVKKEKEPYAPVQTNWLVQLLYIALAICIFWLLMLVANNFVFVGQISDRNRYTFIWIAMSALIYWLGYLGVYHVGVFNQRLMIRSDGAQPVLDVPKSKVQNKSRFDEIDALINEEKLFLNPNLSLSMLAEKMSLSEGYISQHINSFSNTNFSSYINGLRIDEAKKLLKDENYADFTIVSIALESGFNSKSSFYNAFKKHTGMSPSVFRKS